MIHVWNSRGEEWKAGPVLERDHSHRSDSPPATRNPIAARGRKDRHPHHGNDHVPPRGSRQAHDWHVGKKRRRQRQANGIGCGCR